MAQRQEVIDFCKYLLDSANAGTLDGLAGVLIYPTASPEPEFATFHIGACRQMLALTFGTLGVVQAELTAELLTRRQVIPGKTEPST